MSSSSFFLLLFLCYDGNGDMMRHCEFEKDEKYKLFRSVKEILHPTISKKNISDYKIIFRDDLIPVRIFYPKKVSNLQDVFIFIHGDCGITSCRGKYSDISSSISKEYDRLVISIDYESSRDIVSLYDKVSETFQFIISELISSGIEKKHIFLLGDSTGGSMALNAYKKAKLDLGGILLFYPVLSGEYYGKTKYQSIVENNTIDHDLIKKLKNYYKKKNEMNPDFFVLLEKEKISYPNMILLIGGVDPLLDEAKEFSELTKSTLKVLPFANHGFLGSKDKEMTLEYQSFIHQFLEESIR